MYILRYIKVYKQDWKGIPKFLTVATNSQKSGGRGVHETEFTFCQYTLLFEFFKNKIYLLIIRTIKIFKTKLTSSYNVNSSKCGARHYAGASRTLSKILKEITERNTDWLCPKLRLEKRRCRMVSGA